MCHPHLAERAHPQAEPRRRVAGTHIDRMADRMADCEILLPHEADRAAGDRGMNILRGAMRATFDQMSINRYLAVFGAVPEMPPYRQWLCVRRDSYAHIADIWADPALRERNADTSST
jgi:hypothetical protein